MKSAMKKWLCFSLVAGAGATLAGGADGQSVDKASSAVVTANVLNPIKLEPTTERINNLRLPDGFQIRKFAEGQNPRMIAVAANGTVYVSQRLPGTLVMFKDTNRDGRADVQKVVATRKWMHGIAIRGNHLYFVTNREVYRAQIKPDGTLHTPKLLLNNLPDAGQHPNRTIGFGPDGMMYVSVGSTCNACDEPNEENATLLRFTAEGRNKKVFATGLRNTIGFGWHPVSKRLFGFDHGIDFLGDDIQREELNEIKMGKRYGWPYLYENDKVNPHPLPPPPYTHEDWAKMSEAPLLTYTAHSAPMQMAYYTGSQFPAQYRNDAFISMRGSWNRRPPSGYEVLRVKFDRGGKPTAIEPFLTGFLIPNAKGDMPGYFARLAGSAVARDGALLISDDANNIIYRISNGAQNAGRAQTTAMDSRKITFDLPETANARNSIVVRSANFRNNSPIPVRHTAYDKDISPQLTWSGVPRNAKSIVLMMEDPDSLNPKPFAHWLVTNIPPTATTLPGNQPGDEKLAKLGGAHQGSNHMSQTEYFGPKPPADGLVHHYHFQVFALNTKLNLPSGYNRQALVDAMKGHVLAKGQIVGTYKRNPF